METKVKIVRLRDSAKIPTRHTIGSAGYDLAACLDEPMHIEPGEVCMIPTGISCEIPNGFEIQVRPRSGFSTKQKLLIINSPGTIDSDYRGEFYVPMMNLGKTVAVIEDGMRIAQLLLARLETIDWEITDDLSETERGKGGFGSSGV